MYFGFGFGSGLENRGKKKFSELSLFGVGDNGFFYDFSRADTLFQEATGLTPAAEGQNVGLALEQSKWGGKTLDQVLAGQPELRDGGTTGVVGSATAASYNAGSGAGTITRVDVSNQSYVDFNSSANKWYFVDIQNGGTASLVIKDTPGGAVLMSVTSGSRLSGYVRPSTKLVIASSAGTVNFTLHSVKEIPGNHGLQATAGARPVRKTGGFLRFDGADDNLLTTLNPSAAMTLAYKGVVTSGSRGVISSRTGASDSAEIAINAGGNLLGNVGSGTASGSSDIRGLLGVVVLTFDGSIQNLYRNNSQIATIARVGAINTTVPFRIGCRNTSGTGSIFADADIYHALAINRALTPAEIINLTNAWS
jgi:hypothetical protein